MKSQLKCNDKVEFHSTSSADLDGKSGTILGIASEHPENNFWIVKLDNPLPERIAVVITDSCIKAVQAQCSSALITIPEVEYDQLCKDAEWLSYLEAAGVDNWDGIDEAINLRKEANEE